jgi:hypothetical protein
MPRYMIHITYQDTQGDRASHTERLDSPDMETAKRETIDKVRSFPDYVRGMDCHAYEVA